MKVSNLGLQLWSLMLAMGAILSTADVVRALTVQFQFTNATGRTPGTVTGSISGLVEGNNIAVPPKPGSGGNLVVVTVDSSPDSQGIGSYFSDPFNPNTFTVTNGVLTFAAWTGFFNNFELQLNTSAESSLIDRSSGVTLGKGMPIAYYDYSVISAPASTAFTSEGAVPVPAPFAAAGFLPFMFNFSMYLLNKRRQAM